MNYKLEKEFVDKNRRLRRLYINEKTGTQVEILEIYQDEEGVKWFGFVDLYKIPIQRQFMARNITDLYTIGLSLNDIKTWCTQEKALLKSKDPEKYEKLFALILEKEKIATMTADPIRQNLALCTVYVLEDGERIDYFTEEMAEDKIRRWSGNVDMAAFFLSWHNEHIRSYIKTLDKISTTALNLKAGKIPGQSKPLKA